MRLQLLSTALLLATICSGAPAQAQFGRDRPDFFERGQEQLEQTIRQLQTGRPEDSLLTIQGEKLRWQQLILKEGGFTVWMPLAAIVEETETVNTAAGSIDFKVFSTHPKSSRFLVAYADSSALAEAIDAETLLNRVRDGIVKKTNFRLTQDRNVSLWGYPGKELSLTGADETIAIRAYATGERVYVLGVMQSGDGELEEAAIAFFNSFRLLR